MGRKGGALQHPLEDFKKRRKWCGQRPDLQQSTPGVQEEMLAQGEKGTGPGSDTNANHKLRPTKQQVRAGVRTSLGVQPTSGTPWGIAAEPARGALAHSRRRSGWRSPRTSVKRRPKSRAHAHEVGAGVLLARSEQGAEPGRTQSRVRAHGKCTRAKWARRPPWRRLRRLGPRSSAAAAAAALPGAPGRRASAYPSSWLWDPASLPGPSPGVGAVSFRADAMTILISGLY